MYQEETWAATKRAWGFGILAVLSLIGLIFFGPSDGIVLYSLIFIQIISAPAFVYNLARLSHMPKYKGAKTLT